MATRSGRTYIRPSPIARPASARAAQAAPLPSVPLMIAPASPPLGSIQGTAGHPVLDGVTRKQNVPLFVPQNGMDEIRSAFQQTNFYLNNNKLKLLTKEDILNQGKAKIAEHLKKIPSACLGPYDPVEKKYQRTTPPVEYIKASFQEMLEAPYMDFLSIYDEDKDQIVSFIIAHLGECRAYYNYWSVNLICSIGLAGSGQFTLAALLYAAKQDYYRRGITPQKVLLELAAKYTNIAGFISYSRLGFKRDASLYYPEDEKNCLEWTTRSCFCEQGTMAMSCDLDLIDVSRLTRMLRLDLLPVEDDTDLVSASKPTRAKIDSLGNILKAIDDAKKPKVQARIKEITKRQALCTSYADDVFNKEKEKAILLRQPHLQSAEDDIDKRIKAAVTKAKNCSAKLLALANEVEKFSGVRRSSRSGSRRRRSGSRRHSGRRSRSTRRR